MSEYKTIVLQQGLEDVAVDDYQFRKIKSLLRKELNLTEKMQNDYDRIQMADLLEDTFPKDAGLDKLIEVCQSIKDLEELAQRLKTERAKVQKKGKNKTAVKKRKQEEPSSSRSLSTDNELDMSKPSSEEMRKETIKTEGSKKMKFTQEQTQLPEPSGSNTQKDEGCLQTPQKPIPKPSSSSSNKKNTSSKKHNTIETQVSQKKHQLLELSATNNSSAVSELQTLQGLSATASHSIQAPQAPLETCFTLKMPLGSAALSYQNFPGSLASNSNIHLNSPVALTLSSGIQAPHVPSATPCSNVWILQMPSETVSSSFSAPQMAPVSVSSSAQNIHLPTAVAANSKQFPHSPQVITSRCVQSTGVPSAPLKVIKKPPTKQSSNVQVLHALPEAMSRNVCITQVPQITTSSSILTPNSATVKAHRNAKVPGLLEIGSAYSLAFLASPGTSSSSLQASQVLLQATSNSLPAPQVSIPTVTSRVQTTQTHPGAASNVIQDLHAPPRTESRSVCTTQVPPGVSYGTGQAVPCSKVKASRNVHAPQMPSATASKNLLDSRVSPATAYSALQTSQLLLPTTSNSLPAPQVSIPTGTSRVQTTQTHPGAASNVIQDLHAPPWTESRSVCTTQGPQGVSYGTGQAVPCPKVKVSRRVHAPQMPSATASKNLLDSRVSPATAFSALQAPLRPPATRSSSPSRTPNNGNLPKEPSKVQGHHRVAKEVMVLKATEPFTYDLINNKRMFHATVATETEFFRVKVFETALKNKFIPKKIIAISDYTGVSGFLEIHKASCVSEQNVKQTMVISSALRRRANRTPKIKDLFSQTKGTYVNGEFEVTKKNERNDFIYYGIEDDTGKMEVVVSGPLTCIKCEPGNKVQLICFELTSRGDTWQLKSVTHSYMQVINARRRAIQP
ncbi:putative GPI-anchored protein pfl2 [Peromyscus leucopus]|uniref:putative GPI-anchored protein pfl2 n=1 Tax=Peromyscus leucopus TaxID=10041 RepID=UPI0018858178|nr:putative GPI-anchored protein pfl2 [Peromyscus leucopus]XP_037067102.1 putative GPI-anchored protein pfl2 [Peromyscus leucopus]